MAATDKAEADPVLSGLAPVFAADARVLILGSLPGAQSLAKAQYYGNPQNHFWRLITGVTGEELSALDYGARLDALTRHGIALWDSVSLARRKGSLDATLRVAASSDLVTLAAKLPQLRAIAFDGKAAERYADLPQGLPVTVLSLPSSSPTNTMAFARKLEAWRAIAPYLGNSIE